MRPSAADDKSELRRALGERRDALGAAEVRAKSETIARRLGALAGGAGAVGLFAAIRNEVDLTTLFGELRARAVVVAYPRVEPHGRLQFHRVEDLAELAPAGRYRIPEPNPGAPTVEPTGLALIVVPGLAFDAHGHRVGWGGGYYDAFLRQAARARRIGVCYDFQLVASCPRGDRDEPVHVVVTEDRVVHTTPSPKENP